MPAVIEPESLYAGDSWSRSFEVRRPTAGDPSVTEPMPFVSEGWGGWEAQWRPRASAADGAITLTVDASQAENGLLTLSAPTEWSA